MKTLALSAAILALAATAWAEEAKTDSAKAPETPVLRRLPPLDPSKLNTHHWENYLSRDWKVAEFSDEKNGVFVHVKEREQDKPPYQPGVGWLVDVVGPPDRAATVRVRSTPETVSYLIKTPDAPYLPRFLALRGIFSVAGLTPGERLKLIELASRDMSAEIRGMAVIKAGEYAPRSDAIPILCRALCDRSLEVAMYACGPLMNYYYPPDINRKAGENFHELVDKTGDAVGHARSDHAHVLATAQKVHDIRPDLVTDEDLATINSLRELHIADVMKSFEKWLKPPSEAKPEVKPDAKSP